MRFRCILFVLLTQCLQVEDISMSSTTATSPGTTASSRLPVQPTPAAVTPRSRTPSSGSRTPRQISSGSSVSSTGRTLPVPGGGSGTRSSAGSNRATQLQPLMESLPSNHRHGKVCVFLFSLLICLF